MPERLRGLWRQRLRWAEGGGQMLVDNAGPMLRAAAPSLLPVYINAAVAIAWSYCILVLLAIGLLRYVGLPLADWVPSVAIVPAWYELTLCFTYLVQAVMSTTLERRFEPHMLRSLFWIIWYPLAFWVLSATTSVLALPRAFLRPRKGRTTWVSPDRGLR
jgi:biofilm PGA synthesis N-glycosyltransferase PgaC